MRSEVFFTLKSLYRDDLRITGYHFGEGEKSACIVGSLRGNEVQQMYICGKLIQRLTALESEGHIAAGHEILVIPSANHYSMNIGKRFWSLDNTDINRMFPGYDKGETTQRIAAALFNKISPYKLGLQFASFYMSGSFVPHVKMMNLGYQDPDIGKQFGLPYVILRNPRPYDTTVLNYNWQVWETTAFSVYSNATNRIDDRSAEETVQAVLRFLAAQGILTGFDNGPGTAAAVIDETVMVSVHTPCAGIFRRFKDPGDHIQKGEALCDILHPMEGHVLSHITAPVSGRIFFSCDAPLVYEKGIVFRIIPD